MDLDALWTTDQAAEHARVKPGTIRQWKSRGHLPVAEFDQHGHPRYRPLDVARAEYKTREHARRQPATRAA